MSKPLLSVGRLNHSAAAKALKRLGVYDGSTRKDLTKGEKDRVRRLYNKFSDKLSGNWRAVDVGPKLSRSLSYQGFRQHGSKVLVYTGGSPARFDAKSKEIRWSYDDGGVVKRKRLLLDNTTSAERVKRAGRSGQRAGVSIGGNTSYVTFDASDATAYADRMAEKMSERNAPLVTPFFTITATAPSRKPSVQKKAKKRSVRRRR